MMDGLIDALDILLVACVNHWFQVGKRHSISWVNCEVTVGLFMQSNRKEAERIEENKEQALLT